MLKLCCPYIDKYVRHIINVCLENQNCNPVINPKAFGNLRPVSLSPTHSNGVEKVIHTKLLVANTVVLQKRT